MSPRQLVIALVGAVLYTLVMNLATWTAPAPAPAGFYRFRGEGPWCFHEEEGYTLADPCPEVDAGGKAVP